MITIKDVAALAGVSYTTVSHVVNNTRVVSPETRARVEEAVKQLGYCPNVLARGLRRGESKTFGAVGISGSDPYFAQILHGLQEKAWEAGYGVFIAYSDLTESCPLHHDAESDEFYAKRERGCLENLSGRDTQGIMLNSVQHDEGLIETLLALRKPCVLFARDIRGRGWDTFTCDDYQGASDAMRHLLDLGHVRIGLIEGNGYDTNTVKFRKKAWEDRLRERGIEPDPALVRDGRYEIDAAAEATRALLSLPDRPTALLCYSDLMALAAVRAATDMGLAIPRDLSVVGYDDLRMGKISVPRLTTVNQSGCQIGRDMMERLILRAAKPRIEPEFRCYPQSLVVRESSGPASKATGAEPANGFGDGAVWEGQSDARKSS
jgi:LacI family transcriptional regulator